MADADLFERMVEDLEARGLTADQITRARRHWFNDSENELPCPLCFLDGRSGKLQTMPTGFGVERLKCGACKEPIELTARSA